MHPTPFYTAFLLKVARYVVISFYLCTIFFSIIPHWLIGVKHCLFEQLFSQKSPQTLNTLLFIFK